MVSYSKDKGSTVNTMNFDWRWIGIILILLYVVFPDPRTAIVVAAIGAGWMIQAGLQPWRAGRSSFSSTKVTYWRGQRIETRQSTRARIRSVSTIQMLVSGLYLLLGIASAFASLFSFIRLFGSF
jgi:hypothetical protein